MGRYGWCCCCDCPPHVCTPTQGNVTTEDFGSGKIILIADTNVASTSDCTETNDEFWSQLFAVVSGTIAASTATAPWVITSGAYEPTAVYDIDDLATYGAIYFGWFNGSSLPLPLEDACAICQWVRDGGVLIAILDNAGASNMTAALSATNAMLAAIGSCSSFTGEIICIGECVPMRPNVNHSWLTSLGVGSCDTSSIANGEEWVYRCKGYDWPPEPWQCDPLDLGDGELDVLVLLGTLDDPELKVCLVATFDEDTGDTIWVGTGGTEDCPGLTFTLFCDGYGGESPAWKLSVTDGVTTVVLTITISDDDPLSATVSGTLTGICDDAVLVADISPCGGTLPTYPCCDEDFTEAQRCCLPEIPSLYTWHEWDEGALHYTVIGSATYDPVDERWEGTVTITIGGATPVTKNTILECGYILTIEGEASPYTSSDDPCPISDAITFPGVLFPVGVHHDITLHTVPPASPDP